MMAEADECSAIAISGEGAAADEDFETTDLTACPSADSHVGQDQDERLSRGTQLDGSIWSALDEHLQEKIIARLPVRYLVQAASLSKSWRLRFRSDSFRNEVQSSTAPREAYAPLLVNQKKELVGYESSSEQWCRLPTLSYLHGDLVKRWNLRAGDGPLLCWIREKTRVNTHVSDVFQVHVTNPITRRWKQLPARPKMYCPQVVHVISGQGGKAYKVILGDLVAGISCERVFFELQIFDSVDGSWTLDSYNAGLDSDFYIPDLGGGSAFINGVLHVLVVVEGLTSERCTGKLVSFDVNKRLWKEILDLREVIEDIRRPYEALSFEDVMHSKLVVCGSTVMLVVDSSSCDEKIGCIWDEEISRTVSLFRVDVEYGLAFRVSEAPSKMLCHERYGLRRAVGHGDCLYIGCRFPSCQSSICYNVRTQKWHLVKPAEDILRSFRDTDLSLSWLWTPVAYQPGLDPFLEV